MRPTPPRPRRFRCGKARRRLSQRVSRPAAPLRSNTETEARGERGGLIMAREGLELRLTVTSELNISSPLQSSEDNSLPWRLRVVRGLRSGHDDGGVNFVIKLSDKSKFSKLFKASQEMSTSPEILSLMVKLRKLVKCLKFSKILLAFTQLIISNCSRFARLFQ